jgi:hypothetical protein
LLTTLEGLLKIMQLIQRPKFSGVVLYEGPSEIDGSPIVLIATLKSSNVKTGDMVQTWIIRSDMSPLDAHQSGEDYSVCGNCTHRGTQALGIGDGKRTCYVNLGQAPRNIYHSYKRGNYPNVYVDSYVHIVSGRFVRLGAYGDPAAVPLDILEGFISDARGHTGYTHQWKDCNQEFRRYLMASVDSLEEQQYAMDLGWRTFRCKAPHEPVDQKEIVCPATTHNINCRDCLLCSGYRPNARNIVLDVHGPTANTFIKTKSHA